MLCGCQTSQTNDIAPVLRPDYLPKNPEISDDP